MTFLQALLPVANRPMIDYSLESLMLSGVQKTFVYCVSHSDQIKAYLKNSKWSRPVSPMLLEVLSLNPETCISMGDCLRDIDGKNLIRGDFILMSSDVISNVKLIPILEKHKYISTLFFFFLNYGLNFGSFLLNSSERRNKTDKKIIMTHIFKQAQFGHRSRSLDDELVLAINPATERLLHYQKTSNLKKLSFPLVLVDSFCSLAIFFLCLIFICAGNV